ncbi:MAG: hypothetical protein ACI8QT_000205 [Halioglobus sp.]|jgi:hypothetical protein
MKRTPDIRKLIAAAILQEEESSLFGARLGRQLPRLRKRLILPESGPISALIGFVAAYIESVPGSITLVTAVSKQLGFYCYVAPFLHTAEDYFIQPPNDIDTDSGLEGLLDEAFVAHRLLEEVNDYHIARLGHPLLPLDMTHSNIIVHHLLGEPLANRLENLVQDASSQLLPKAGLWKTTLQEIGSTRVWVFKNRLSDPEQQIQLRTTPTM